MAEGQNSDVDPIQEELDNLSQFTPGHSDEKGNLIQDPEFVKMEIKNKTNAIDAALQFYQITKKSDQADRLGPLALQKLFEIFPGKEELITDTVKGLREFSKYLPKDEGEGSKD